MPFLERTLEFARSVRTKIQSQPVTLEEALGMALKLEESMVEIFTNALISGNNDSFERNVEEMLVDERGHIDRIKNEMINREFLKPT